MSDVRTHLQIDHGLCGAPEALEPDRARARFVTDERMRVDAQGLVHGGFVFGLVDHAAMLAVNDPLVVLGSSDVRFLAPVRVGDEVVASAVVTETKGKKRVVSVEAHVGERKVLEGTLVAFVLEAHVLDA